MVTAFIILALLVIIVLGVIVYKLSKKNEEHENKEQERQDREDDIRRDAESTSSHPVTRAKVGDLAIFEGADADFNDIQFSIDRINRYEQNDYRWIEVSGMCNGERQHIEVHDDDEPYITMCVEDDIRLAALGIDEDFLIECDESQNDELTFQYDDKIWRFIESGETMYFKNGKGHGEGYYSWDFVCVDDDSIHLYVEKWEDEPFEVGISRNLIAESVQLYAC